MIVTRSLKRIREAHGITQKQLSRKLKIRSTYVSAIERAVTPLSFPVALDLVDEFGSLIVERHGCKYEIRPVDRPDPDGEQKETNHQPNPTNDPNQVKNYLASLGVPQNLMHGGTLAPVVQVFHLHLPSSGDASFNHNEALPQAVGL